MIPRLRDLLGLLDDRIDPARVSAARDLAGRALRFEAVPYLPVRVDAPAPRSLHITPYPYAEAFCDPEKMLYNELSAHAAGLAVADERAWSLRAHYGVGVLPSAFGCPSRPLGDSLPWVEHVDGVEAVRRLVDAGRPSVEAGLLGRCWETYRVYAQALADYPRLRAAVTYFHPDLQGPFDAAHLIWGPGIYLALYDDPALVHRLLDVVTETYLEALGYYKDLVGEGNDATAHWGLWMRGGAMLRCDSAVCLSRAMYEEFVRPYDARVLAAFGGAIHHCGPGAAFFESLITTPGLAGINFGEPLLQDLDRVLEVAAARRVAVIGLPAAQWTPERRHRYRTGLILTADAPSVDAARAVRARCRPRGAGRPAH